MGSNIRECVCLFQMVLIVFFNGFTAVCLFVDIQQFHAIFNISKELNAITAVNDFFPTYRQVFYCKSVFSNRS